MITRRRFLKRAAAGGAGLLLPFGKITRSALAANAGGMLDPLGIQKFVMPLAIPPAMPLSARVNVRGGRSIEYYEIAVRQFMQQILPSGMPVTTVWSYGSVNHSGSFFYPAFTIEAKVRNPVQVKWINGLKDGNGNYLPHLLPVDPTLHWANPPGGYDGRDMRPTFTATPGRYTGPVPIVTHVHGAHTQQESDGYPEAWYLPDALDIPPSFARTGTFYDQFRLSSPLGGRWGPGSAVFQYPNDQRAATLWYHDHSLGMTRLNVYAGPAGFYLLRGGPGDLMAGMLPGPAPALGDPPGMSYYEIPIVIQDRSFNNDGSLFYPDNRAFFEGLHPSQLKIPFIGEDACEGPSDVSPIWNPEFFGNTIVVNGRTWPYLNVERRRYRFRFLNGCDSRFLILKLNNDLPFWQIGADGGFLPAPVQLDRLLIAPAERADVIVDFTQVPVGAEIVLLNLGPDEPFGGGEPPTDFDQADPATTGQVMLFRVVPETGTDSSTPPDQLNMPSVAPLPAPRNTRSVSLNEEESRFVKVIARPSGNTMLACYDPEAEPFGPTSALLGTLAEDGSGKPLLWGAEISENPRLNSTEVWEIHNFTEDAHPIHVHMVQFQVIDRHPMEGAARAPESWETGFKDTVIAYPEEVTRIKAKFDIPGRFVWHCHILEHEDNEMMRPYSVS